VPTLGVDPPPGVDPFVGWVIGGLVATVLAQAGVVYKLVQYIITTGLEREKAAAAIATHSIDVNEENTHALERVNELLDRTK